MALVDLGFTGPVATLQLSRPEARNALSVELCDAIVSGLARVEVAKDARVLLVTGAGPVFCSGADFASVGGPGGVEFLPAFERMLEALGRHRLPTIAVIQGAALGGGLQLAVACDFRIAAEDAKLAIPSSRLGVVVNLENVERLVNLVGAARAKEVLMTGRVFTGIEAVEAGLANDVASAEGLAGAADAYAAEIALLAPLSVQAAKKSIHAVLDRRAVRAHDPQAALEIDALVAEAYSSRDLEEGIRAQREKRAPDFEGE